MVLRIINIIGRIFLFIAMVLFFSCEDPGTVVINCGDCLSKEPTEANLRIKLDYINTRLTVNIYEGNLEDNILYDTFKTSSAVAYYNVLLNKKYTLTVSYLLSGGINYIAVNTVYPHVVYDEDVCEEPCYYVYDRDVNLKLKYTKRKGK